MATENSFLFSAYIYDNIRSIISISPLLLYSAEDSPRRFLCRQICVDGWTIFSIVCGSSSKKKEGAK